MAGGAGGRAGGGGGKAGVAGGRAGGGGGQRRAAGNGGAAYRPPSDDDAESSSGEDRSRGAKTRRVEREDSEESAESVREARHSDDDEEEEEEQGEVLSCNTIEERSPCTTQQIADAQRWEEFQSRHHFATWGLTQQQAEPDALLGEGITGGLASFVPVRRHPNFSNDPARSTLHSNPPLQPQFLQP
jgi:hypothetical protein